MYIYTNKEYAVLRNSRGYIVKNLTGEYKNHSHFNNLGAAKKCIQLTQKKIIPRYSLYMLTACLRLTTNGEYRKKIEKLLEVKKQKTKQKCRKRKNFNK